ncbi:MAG: hypothetical protein OXG51_17440 [Gammaproteobacteria bacterium]|nr:hypothetical protein [Gammaproteobacteria bacterium]
MDAQSAVQQLLLDQGAYSPLELLLATGLVSQGDYLARRRGEIGSLDEALEDRLSARGLLEAARAFALKLGLAAERVGYEGWEANAGLDLLASFDRALNALLRIHYRRIPVEGEGQLDLFLDSGATAALNDLQAALLRRNPDDARGALLRLGKIRPDQAAAPLAQVLIEALRTAPPANHEQALERLERIKAEWAPAASRLLAGRAQDFLRPLWQGVASGLDPSRFEAADSERHVSWIHRQCLDWENVKASILAVPGHWNVPALVERLAEAEWWLRDRISAVAHWFALCRSAPERFKAMLDVPHVPDAALLGAWRAAKASDIEPEVTIAWFPAWMLLAEPGLARVLDFAGGKQPPDRAFDLLKALLTTEADNIDRRAELAAVHRGLLERFLELRG